LRSVRLYNKGIQHNIDVDGMRYSSDYGSAASQVTVDAPDAVICTNEYSEEVPYTMGLVKFPVTEDRSVSFSCSSSPS